MLTSRHAGSLLLVAVMGFGCGKDAATPDAHVVIDASPDGPVVHPDAAPLPRYPTTAAELHALVGGTWSVGWLLDEASGTLMPTFGTMTLAPTGTPGYGVAGPVNAGDKAIQILANTDFFEGDDSLFPGPPTHANTDDVAAVWVARNDQGTTQAATLFGNWASDNQGWLVVDDGAGNIQVLKSSTEIDHCQLPATGAWYVGMVAFDKAAAKMRIAIRSLDGTVSCTSPGVAFTDFIGPFGPPKLMRLGKGLGTELGKLQSVAALYIGVGPGVAAGLPANLATAMTALVKRLTTGQ